MLSRKIVSALARIVSTPTTTPSTGAPPALPDTYNVGFGFDWSSIASPPASEIPPPYDSTATRALPTTPTPAMPLILSPQPSVSSGFLSPVDPATYTRVPTREYNSLYGQGHPIKEYYPGHKTLKSPESTPDSQSAGSDIEYASALERQLSTPRPSVCGPFSPATSTGSHRTRPLFIPSRPSTPTPAVKSGPMPLPRTNRDPLTRGHTSVTQPSLSKKRKMDTPELEIKPLAKKSRPSNVIALSDDDDDDYGFATYDTGYQGGSSSNSQYIDTPSNQTQDLLWRGPLGGEIKFIAKPSNFDEHAFSRWTYSSDGPDVSTVDERTEGDIHFGPAKLKAGNDPFAYWVCKWFPEGPRWVRFQCGQQHPHYKGFVLQSAVSKSKTPVHWVKESSFKSSRSR